MIYFVKTNRERHNILILLSIDAAHIRTMINSTTYKKLSTGKTNWLVG